MDSVFTHDILEILLRADLKAEIVSIFVSGCGAALDTILCVHKDGRNSVRILPADIYDTNPEAAHRTQSIRQKALEELRVKDGAYPLIISRDRWERQHDMTVARLLAHLGIYQQIYARNCEVRRIDKPTAAEFLERTHSYGDASCRYRYGLYLKRHTGHLATSSIEPTEEFIAPGTLVAVATFSGGRRWQKGDKIIRSHEWTRYASLPQLRLSGGMGKLLKHFIKEEKPDDIMSYADLEWSEGVVYEGLGFELESTKDPVLFVVDPVGWTRIPSQKSDRQGLYHQNFGSLKYRKILTEYH